MTEESQTELGPAGRERPFSGKRAWWVSVGLLLPLHLLLAGWIGARMSPTSDEIAHLAAGMRIWNTGRTDLYQVNPPLVKALAAAPVMLTGPRVNWLRVTSAPGEREEWAVGLDVMIANWSESRWHFLLARWMCLPLSALGLVYCHRWSAALFGPWAGTAAAACWTFSPNILGNAALITPDVPAAALALACLFHWRSWLMSGSWRQALVCGALLGLANLTKFTSLLLLPILLGIGLWAQSRWAPAAWAGGPRVRQTAQFALLLLVALDVVWTGYLYRGLFQPLGRFDFVSQSFTGLTAGETGNRFESSWLGACPVPVPADFLIGLDVQRRDLEATWQPLSSYMRGEVRLGGWWFYYLYGMLVKAPLGAWLLAVLAVWGVRIGAHTRDFDGANRSPRHWEWLLLLVPSALLLVVLSAHLGFSRYFRYAVPCFPFVYVAYGVCWSRGAVRHYRWLPVAASGALLLSAVESLSVFPNQLAFFNVAAGGVQNGHWHLLDSNCDWGQDLYALRDWQKAHPETPALNLAYSGVADPAVFEIRFTPQRRTADEFPLPAGWYAVSANHLHGYDSALGPWNQFLSRVPQTRVGASIFLYHLEND